MIHNIDGYFVVLSDRGKKLGGPYETIDEARNRMSQVERFEREAKVKKDAKRT